MTSLVVHTAYGAEYLEMSRLSTDSLRAHGYAGEVWLMGARRAPDPATAMLARLDIPDAINLSLVDRLWYLDCDIVCVDDWGRIEARLTDADVAVVASACTTQIGDPFVSGCLTPTELAEHAGDLACNSGVIGINLHHPRWRDLWADWRDLSLERAQVLTQVDESAPNAVALRWGLPHLGADLIHYPANPASRREGVALIHYAGLTGAERMAQMRADAG